MMGLNEGFFWYRETVLAAVKQNFCVKSNPIQYESCTGHFDWGFFLRAFAKFRKAAVSFVMSVRMEHLGSHRTDFHEIVYLSSFRKSMEKIQVSLQSEHNNNRYCTCRPIYIFNNISLSSS